MKWKLLTVAVISSTVLQATTVQDELQVCQTKLKQLIEKKSSQKNLVCKRFEYNVYRPSQRDLKLYL